MLTYIILLGSPGAGKDTEFKVLTSERYVPHISSGDIFRDKRITGQVVTSVGANWYMDISN